MENSWSFDTAVYLAAAVVAVPLFKRLRLGAVLGYLAAGSLLGPWALGFIKDPSHTLHLAEFGVVLLLFLIGLELRPSRLWNMRYAVFGLGGAQVAITTLLLAFIAWSFELSWTTSFIVGFSLSLSSTALALQLLGERQQLNTAFGRASFAILLFQDLITIPVLALLPVLGTTEDTAFSWGALSKAVGAVAGLILGGRFLIRPYFYRVGTADTREVFLAAALLLVLGVALLMESIGLSAALGGFLTGVVLSDSEYRHRIEADIEPFKGLLLGLFFISVGTSVDYGLVAQKPSTIVLSILLLLVVKYLVIFFLGRWAKLSSHAARQVASALPQGGEFAFVLLGVATMNGLLNPTDAALITVVVIASMIATPFIGLLDEYLFTPLFRPPTAAYDTIVSELNPVILAGFGRVGQMVARILRLQNIGFTTLESDAEQVNVVRKFGTKVFYGDATRRDLLQAAGASQAKYLVLAIDDVAASVKAAAVAKEHFPHLKIFARARNRQHVYELKDLGVTHIWRETIASSMELAEGLLLDMNTPPEVARAIITRFRAHDQDVLEKQYELHHDEKAVIQYSKQSVQQLIDAVNADRLSKPGT
ncbi:monovalent cation:proton antiporter-2 (CPA2) family protein [bacterium]|nr:monovalent cation:proton antiporter-2 (CPA2) family protein [bacterium]